MANAIDATSSLVSFRIIFETDRDETKREKRKEVKRKEEVANSWQVTKRRKRLERTRVTRGGRRVVRDDSVSNVSSRPRKINDIVIIN